MDSQLLFTPAAVLDLLLSIDELRGSQVELQESPSGVQIQIGNSQYSISADSATDIDVDSEVLSDVTDVADEAFDNMQDSGEVESIEPVESGVLKNIVKSLLLGGMIRLSTKLLK